MSNVYRLPAEVSDGARWTKQATPVLWWREYPRCAFCGEYVFMFQFNLVEIAGTKAALKRESLPRHMLVARCESTGVGSCGAHHLMEAKADTPWWRRYFGDPVQAWVRMEYSS